MAVGIAHACAHHDSLSAGGSHREVPLATSLSSVSHLSIAVI
jgi:hypothetical protein